MGGAAGAVYGGGCRVLSRPVGLGSSASLGWGGDKHWWGPQQGNSALVRSSVSTDSPAGKGSICPDFLLCYTSFSAAPPPPSSFGIRVFRKLGVNPLGCLTELSNLLGYALVWRGGRLEPMLALCAAGVQPQCGESLTHCFAPHTDAETQGQTLGVPVPAACEETETPQQVPLRRRELPCPCPPVCSSTGSLFPSPTKLRSPSSLPPMVCNVAVR